MVVGFMYCPDCGERINRDIKINGDGIPERVCPECGVVRVDRGWYKYVNQKEAIEIIEHRGRRGCFVQKDGGTYIGIDNTDGDAWVEEFPDLIECLHWLLGDKEERT